MITATVLAIFLVPVFYVVIRTLCQSNPKPAPAAPETGKRPGSGTAESPGAT
jgi:hypothetical protein